MGVPAAWRDQTRS